MSFHAHALRGRPGPVGLHRLVAVVAALVMLTAAPVAQARPPAARHLAQPTPVRAVRVPMLMYHLIATPQPATPNQGLWVDPSEFQAEVTWLAGHGYHAVTVAQWWDAGHGGIALPSRPIVFTFDDGFRGWYTSALPIMRAQGWVGSMQLALSHLGALQAVPAKGLSPYAWKIQPYMIREMIADGWELDSHSLTHPMLTTVSAAQLHAEVYDSRAALQAEFGVPVSVFCYPYGDYDGAVINAVEGAGYEAALSTNPGIASSRQNPYALDRIGVGRGEGVAGIRATLRSYGLPVSK
jgi:peptidoglycan/xylan/chitin deacetylase (PgdA/CDA1 family)